MTPNELNEARTNPDFLKYLDEREKEVLKAEDIAGLYEILDTLLVLDLDTKRVDKIYGEILKITFDKIEDRLKIKNKLSLDNDDLYLIRGFYEYAIEKWSLGDFKGAKELFFILTQIVEDNILIDSLNIHLIATANSENIDDFSKKVDLEKEPSEEKYGYFILAFSFDIKDYLDNNKELLKEQFNQLKSLLN